MRLRKVLSRILVTSVCVFGLALGPASAQHVTASLGITGAVPHDEFGDHLQRVGFGVSGTLLYGIGPIAAGVELGHVTYDRQAAPLTHDLDRQSAFVGDVTSRSNIGQVHAVLRLLLPEGPFRP
jgi:hypothetical protein